MKNFLESLKKQNVFSFLAPPSFHIRYVPDPVDGFVLSDREGFLTGEDVEILCEELLKTAKNKSDIVKQVNQQIKEIQGGRQQAIGKARKSNQGGFVYLIKAETGHYKIGYSKSPFDRAKTFEVKLPFKVELIHQVEADDPYQAESFLHHRYHKKRVNGEWFKLSRADVKYICKLKSYSDGRFYT